MSHFWQLILGTVVALLAITEGDADERRAWQVKKGCYYMVLILVGALFGGDFIIRFFGVSIPGIRIAGGLLVSGIALSMLATPQEDAGERRRQEEARAKRDISVSPLAMPMLSGPGSIAMTIGFTSLAGQWLDYVAIVLGIMLVALISYVILRLSGSMVRVIGANGMYALTKFMCFLLLCIGVQFVVNGVTSIATDPDLLQAIHAGLNR
jgi:multiple antibiotic resistance protein